jgi:hypothetical protein
VEPGGGQAVGRPKVVNPALQETFNGEDQQGSICRHAPSGCHGPSGAEDIRAQTAAGAVTRDSGTNIQDPSAMGLIYAAKDNQSIGRSRVAPNTKPIRTPGQCFRRCLRLKGTTEGFCYASCY